MIGNYHKTGNRLLEAQTKLCAHQGPTRRKGQCPHKRFNKDLLVSVQEFLAEACVDSGLLWELGALNSIMQALVI